MLLPGHGHSSSSSSSLGSSLLLCRALCPSVLRTVYLLWSHSLSWLLRLSECWSLPSSLSLNPSSPQGCSSVLVCFFFFSFWCMSLSLSQMPKLGGQEPVKTGLPHSPYLLIHCLHSPSPSSPLFFSYSLRLIFHHHPKLGLSIAQAVLETEAYSNFFFRFSLLTFYFFLIF